MLFSLMTVGLVLGLATSIMPALFDEIRKDLDLTHGQLGVIWGALAFGILLTAFVGGTLGDRFGIKKTIALGLFISGISCILRALLPSFWGQTFALLVLGAASGLVFPNMPKAVGMWFSPKELGRALGFIQMEGTAAWAVALMIGASLSSILGGWQNVMWLMAAISFAGIFFWMFMARERPAQTAHTIKHVGNTSSMADLKRLLKMRDLWLVALMDLCVGGAALSNIGLLPETLEARGMTPSMAGIYTSISTWVIAASAIIGAFFSDKIGLRKPFIWPFLFISAGTITFFGVFIGIRVVVMIVIYSAALGVTLPLFRALVIENERIDSNLSGSALGVIYTINRLGAIGLPVAMGATIDITGEYWPAFLLLAILIAIGAVLSVPVKETGWKVKRQPS